MLQIRLPDVSRIFWGLLAFELLLLLLHIVVMLIRAQGGGQTFGARYFDMDGESNLPAWFSGSQLLLIGMVSFLNARLSNLQTPPTRTFFCLVGILFIYLSLDEVTSLHEHITHVTRGVEWVPHFRGHRGVWVFVYLPLGLLLIILAHRHLRSLWQLYRTESLLLSAGVLTYVAGTAGLDVLSIYMFPGHRPVLSYGFLVGSEEFLEMFGASLILLAALRLLAKLNQPGTS